MRPRSRIPFRRDRLSQGALLILLIMVLLCVLQLVVSLGDPRAIGGPRLSGLSWSYLLGTDALGRSLLPRVIEGMRTTFLISLMAVVATTAVATVIGMLSALAGGAADEVVVRIADMLFSFPGILLAILVAAVVGAGGQAALIAIVILTLPLMVRVVRAASLVVLERDFVVSSEVGGASVWRVLFVHVLPNIAGAVVIQATYAASVAMLVEGGLSFLGFGVRPPNASLGSLVQEGITYLVVAPWLTFIPGLLLALAILCVNLVGDGLRDRLDPLGDRMPGRGT